MATQVGQAVIKLSFDGSGVKGELANTEKSAESTGSKIGKTAKNISKVLVASFATATASAVAFSKKSVDAFNESEQALAKLNQSAKNQNWAEGAVEDLEKYNAELQRAGIIGDEVNAAGQAQLGTFALSAQAVKTLTPAMDDLLAATSGYETTADNATQMANLMGKVMTGNVGALTRYGVTLDEHQKKLLADGDEMTRAATLAEVLKQNYGGFNEALAKTPQGTVKQLSNSFSDLKESFGAFIAGKGDLSGFFNNLSIVMSDSINLITTMVPQFVSGIVQLIEQIGAQLPTLLQELMPILTQALVDLTIAFVNALPNFIQAVIDIIISVGNAILNNIGTILNALTSAIIQVANLLTQPENLSLVLDGAITLFLKIAEAIPEILTALIEALPTIIDNIVTFLTEPENLQKIIDGAVKLFTGIVQAVPQILGALLQAFGTLVGNLWDWITQKFGEFADNFGNFIGDIFKNAINGVLSFIENIINGPIDLINGFLGIINDAFGWIGVHIDPIGRINLPRLAEGGVVNSATTAIIGEDGQEAVIPLQHNTGNWAGLLAETLAIEMEEQDYSGKEINVYMTNQISNKLDANDIGRLMIQSIRRAA